MHRLNRQCGNSLRRKLIRLILLTCGMVLVVRLQPTYAQVDTGSIQGTVKDQSGAVVPGAKVTVTNQATSLSLASPAGPDGSYMFTPLKIGTYSVSAESPGFTKAVQSAISLSIDQHLVVDLTLKPGAVTQTIEVTAAAPVLQTQEASVGQVVGARDVNNLPLNGRNFTFLAQTAAGVTTPEADTRGNAASGAFSANGLRPAENNYLLDWVDNNSDNVDFLNGTNYMVLPPVDAISEFKVQTNDYSAQYGRSAAAILNATIKSGTNGLHGNLYEFFRNDKLDAADFFEDVPGVHKGEFRLNQFGGTIGGPVVIPHVYNGKDKLFFFGDVQIDRRRQGSVFTSSVPTALERSSNFTNFADMITGQVGSAAEQDALGRTFPAGTILDPATTRPVTAGEKDPVTGITAPAGATGYVRDPFYAGSLVGITNFTSLCATDATCQLNLLPAGRLDQNAVKILGLYPAPNGTIYGENYTSNPDLIENREAFDIRMDYNKGDKDQIFGTFSWVNDPQFIPAPFTGIADGGAFQQGDQPAKSFLAALSYTHMFSPTTINEVRLGESRLHTSRYGPVATTMNLPAQYGISTSIPQVPENGGLPAFTIAGLNTLGSNNYLPSDEITQTTQVTDNFTKIYGKHSFKMGIELQHVKFSTLQPPWSHGQYEYDGTYTGIPNGPSGNTGAAQFLLLPCPGPTAGGTPTGCPSVANALPDVGGVNSAFSSNIGFTDDGKNYWGTYFEDDWKVSPKLTLNLGLRWEWFGQVFEHFGAQANMIPGGGPNNGAELLYPANRDNPADFSTSFKTLMAQDGIKIVGTNNRGVGNSQKTNFAPRVGFAYQVTPKLVARGGFGIFYNSFENEGYGPNLARNYPFQYGFSFFAPNGETPISSDTFSSFAGTPCANAFMFETGFDCTPLNPLVVSAAGLGFNGQQYNYKTPMTMGYNVAFQYQLAPTLGLTMAYVGNQSRHSLMNVGANNGNDVTQFLPPGTNTLATSAPGVGLYLPFPDFGGMTYMDTIANSDYNGLQTTLEKRFASGLNFLANYTYSRCRGDAGDTLNGTSIGYRAPLLPNFGLQGDYGDCNFDIRHVFHFSGGYELPFGKGKAFLSSVGGAGNQVVGGWSMIWNLVAETGQPETISCDTGPLSGLGCNALLVPGQNRYGSGAPDHFWNPAAFTQPCVMGGTTPAGCVPETGYGLLGGADSDVSGPGITRLDFSLFKNFRLSDRSHLEFRGEFFNILNHPTFNAPGFGGNGVVAISGSKDPLSSHFGQIGSTRFPFNDPRQIQLALKLYF